MGRREGANTQALELTAQHLSADKRGVLPVRQGLAKFIQSKFIHSSAVWSEEEGSRGDFRPSSKIPVHATQAPENGNGSLQRAVRERCCKALASLSTTRCSEVSRRRLETCSLSWIMPLSPTQELSCRGDVMQRPPDSPAVPQAALARGRRSFCRVTAHSVLWQRLLAGRGATEQNRTFLIRYLPLGSRMPEAGDPYPLGV